AGGVACRLFDASPSPLWGGARGGRKLQRPCSAIPPSLSLTHEGGGDASGWGAAAIPRQRNRLGGVADVVARQAEQLGVHAARHHVGERAAQREGERQAV